MNKKMFALLFICIAIISISSVCAVELTKTTDFNNFKMNISSTDIVNVLNDSLHDENGGNTYFSNSSWTVNNNVSVYYYESAMDGVISNLKAGTVFMDDPTIDGNLTILEDTTSPADASYRLTYLVGVSSGDKTVFIGCNNSDTAKEYANTIVF